MIRLKILTLVLALSVIILAGYSLITNDYSYSHISSLILGVIFIVLAIDEFKKNGKNKWVLCCLSVSILIILPELLKF